MKYFSEKFAIVIGDYFHLNWNVINPKIWHYALNVELEHGTHNPLTNVTNDDPFMTAKIALAHLLEYPHYYDQLKIMERKLKKEMNALNGKKINIFTN